MGMLAVGSILAVDGTALLVAEPIRATLTLALAYSLIGAGVGAAGTAVLAMLAAGVPAKRRAAAAAITWIMMVAGIAVSAGVIGGLIQPFSLERLALIAGALAMLCFLVAILAVVGLERALPVRPRQDVPPRFAVALAEVKSDPAALRFTIFVFLSMLAYSMQDLILEPFAGIAFGLTPGESTQLAGIQHGGVLIGMIVAGVGGSAFRGKRAPDLTRWIVAGCIGSAGALVMLATSSAIPGFPLAGTVFALGAMNGLFAVAAIGMMMRLAGAGRPFSEGVRMGVWGAAQAIGFGLGGVSGAVLADFGRAALGDGAAGFQMVFAIEAALFAAAAMLAARLGSEGGRRTARGELTWRPTTQS
jgi:BCD family chlorophyll transporter-like MFS transporter